MKRIVLLTCALAIATLASAQLYKYVDKNGKTVYTDQPPPDADDPKAMRIPSSATGAAPPPGKSAVAQDKELQKGPTRRRKTRRRPRKPPRAPASRKSFAQTRRWHTSSTPRAAG
jgi:hypothetical protein